MSQYPPTSQVPFAPPPKKGLGTGAIIAIVLGVVALVAIVCGGLLIAIMLPALGKARNMARGLKSTTQITALVQGCHLYASDNKDFLPPLATWDSAIGQYVPTSGAGSMTDSPQIEGTGNEMIYTPPKGKDASGLAKTIDATMPSTWVLIREDESKLAPNQMVAVGFLDGSVQLLTQQDLAARLTAQKSGR